MQLAGEGDAHITPKNYITTVNNIYQFCYDQNCVLAYCVFSTSQTAVNELRICGGCKTQRQIFKTYILLLHYFNNNTKVTTYTVLKCAEKKNIIYDIVYIRRKNDMIIINYAHGLLERHLSRLSTSRWRCRQRHVMGVRVMAEENPQ